MSKLTTKLDTYAEFLEFNRLNPALYQFFLYRAREARDAGNRRIGFTYVYEMARYEFGVKVKNSEWALDNDLRAFYARYIMMHEPDLFDFFNVRSCAADWQIGWTAFKEAKVNQPQSQGDTQALNVIDVTTYTDAEPQFVTVSEPTPSPRSEPTPKLMPPAKPVRKVTCIGGKSYIVDDDGEVVSAVA